MLDSNLNENFTKTLMVTEEKVHDYKLTHPVSVLTCSHLIRAHFALFFGIKFGAKFKAFLEP